MKLRINVPGYGVGEEGGSEVVAEVSGRQCAKGSLGVSDGDGIERLDASRQREFQYNHPSSTTYWRTWWTVKSFASTQNRQNHWVYAEPAARRNPCGKLNIGWHKVGASSYHRSIYGHMARTCNSSYISCKAPHRAFPCWVANSAARETKEVASELISS